MWIAGVRILCAESFTGSARIQLLGADEQFYAAMCFGGQTLVGCQVAAHAVDSGLGFNLHLRLIL